MTRRRRGVGCWPAQALALCIYPIQIDSINMTLVGGLFGRRKERKEEARPS